MVLSSNTREPKKVSARLGGSGELNRSGLIVYPKQSFLDWLHSIDPTSSEITLDDLGREPDIYLISECGDEAELVDCLRDVYSVIFEDQLAGWWTYENDWPKERPFAMFQEWFDCRFHSMVIDLCDDPLMEYE
jgi:hypothetical protein